MTSAGIQAPEHRRDFPQWKGLRMNTHAAAHQEYALGRTLRHTAILWVAALAAVSAWPASSLAGLIVTVSDTVVELGGSPAFVNVNIRSTTGTDRLDSFGLELSLTPLLGSGLKFTNPPLDPQLSRPNYVFAGNSVDAHYRAACGKCEPGRQPLYRRRCDRNRDLEFSCRRQTTS